MQSIVPVVKAHNSLPEIIPPDELSVGQFGLFENDAVPEYVFAGAPLVVAPDIVSLHLRNKRKATTRRAYEGDLRQFFGDFWGDPTPAGVGRFLDLEVKDLAWKLAEYKIAMLAGGLSEATINRRLAAVRSLLGFAHRMGLARSDGRNLVDGERVKGYRDTRGVDVSVIKQLLKAPAKLHGTKTVRGLRDAALLSILCENALRRAEVCALDVTDFSLRSRSLAILGKGRGTQKEIITVSSQTAAAIGAYLLKAGHAGDKGPMFRSLDHRPDKRGERLTTNGLYVLIKLYGSAVGVENLTPHKLRHSAITAALDATGGDVRRVQRLSRHTELKTLQIYDDNRQNFQGEVTDLLAGLFR